MTATGHALVAALLAAKITNPYIVLPIAFVSHIACDMLPHWDSGTHYRKKTKKRFFIEASIDVVVSIISSYIFYRFLGGQNAVLLYSAVFFAQLLDWISIPSYIFKLKLPILNSIQKFQSSINVTLDKPWGIVTQVVAVGALYVVLFWVF